MVDALTDRGGAIDPEKGEGHFGRHEGGGVPHRRCSVIEGLGNASATSHTHHAPHSRRGPSGRADEVERGPDGGVHGCVGTGVQGPQVQDIDGDVSGLRGQSLSKSPALRGLIRQLSPTGTSSSSEA